MNDSKIPVRYAKALFELSVEKNLINVIHNDIILIDQLVKMEEVKDMLESPVVSSGQKKKFFKALLDKKINELTLSFIDMVVHKNRETYLEGIARNFIVLYKRSKNIKTVELTTAIEIDDEQKNAFQSQVLKTYKATIELKTKVNPDIVGGFIVQIDDVLYDASVKRQLRNIQNKLIKEKL